MDDDDEMQYLLWVARCKREAQMASDRQRHEFNTHYWNDMNAHAPQKYRMRFYWVRMIWHMLFGLHNRSE